MAIDRGELEGLESRMLRLRAACRFPVVLAVATVFVRPAILKMTGAAAFDLPKLPARLSVDLENEGERAHYLRGKFEGGNFAPTGRQESHALFGLSEANALLRVESGKSLKAGDAVEIEIF